MSIRSIRGRGGYNRRKQTLYQNTLLINCCYCNEPLTYQQATVEHIINRADGGKNTKDNLAISCRSCNNHRVDYSFDEWKRLVEERYEETRKGYIPRITDSYSLMYHYFRKNNRLIERKYLR